jgi:hypothetical protein
MTQAIQQRCLHHHTREAAVRCPVCRNYFCRECVTEHDDRLVCAGCLHTMRAPTAEESRGVWRWIAPMAGLTVAWSFYAALGWALSNLL